MHRKSIFDFGMVKKFVNRKFSDKKVGIRKLDISKIFKIIFFQLTEVFQFYSVFKEVC